jgi:carbon starvation protein
VFAGSLFPFVFITIACGALSGFHALISSGTTPKLIEKESQIRMIGYGAMLTESFVAIMALAAACVLDPGLYFAMNMPGTVLGTTVESASEAVKAIGYTISPQDLAAAAAAVEEKTLAGRTGGAPTLAVGLSQIFSQVMGGDELRAFWYHFAIMFEALFILTTVDAGTRVGRFMLQDTVGNIWPRYRDTTWKPAAWSASAIIVGLWGYLLWAGVNDPLGGIYQLFPLFGIANQLLAAVALAVCTTLLIKSGRAKYAWITLVPLAFDAAVTLTASYQKIFSADPKLGFWAQRNQYQAALDAGKTSLGTAKTPAAMQQVVFNTTLDTALTALFAILIVIVLADSIRVWIAALTGRPLSSGSEDPHVESKLWAPAGLIPTREEREHQRELAHSGGSAADR